MSLPLLLSFCAPTFLDHDRRKCLESYSVRYIMLKEYVTEIRRLLEAMLVTFTEIFVVKQAPSELGLEIGPIYVRRSITVPM